MTTTSRERFEAWVKANYPPIFDFAGSFIGPAWFYDQDDLQSKWESWQAAERAMAERAAKVEWKPIEDAPCDGSPIIGIYPDGSEVELRWAESRRCMLAGTGGGNGYFGAGWEDTENRLIANTPILFRRSIVP